MAMNAGSKGVQADLNVTPLIDILLVLLIIFMVVVPLKMMQHRVDVPKKAEVDLPPDVTQDQVVLTYTKDGELFLNTDKIQRNLLAKRLSDIFKNRREKTIFINIDPLANYGESMRVIDITRNTGLDKLAIITLKKDDDFQVPSMATPTSPTGI